MNHGHRKGKEVQSKSKENISNKITGENFPNLRKTVIHV
jgi:hypothetical protein